MISHTMARMCQKGDSMRIEFTATDRTGALCGRVEIGGKNVLAYPMREQLRPQNLPAVMKTADLERYVRSGDHWECEIVRTLTNGSVIVRGVKRLPSKAQLCKDEEKTLLALIAAGNVAAVQALANVGWGLKIKKYPRGYIRVAALTETTVHNLGVETWQRGYASWDAIAEAAEPEGTGGYYGGGSYCSPLGEEDD